MYIIDWNPTAADKEDDEEWADDWDDEEADTDFDKVLKAELAKLQSSTTTKK